MRLDALAIAELLRKFREAQRTLRQSYRAKPIYPPQDPERAPQRLLIWNRCARCFVIRTVKTGRTEKQLAPLYAIRSPGDHPIPCGRGD
jgi:hypothetical protein